MAPPLRWEIVNKNANSNPSAGNTERLIQAWEITQNRQSHLLTESFSLS